MHLGMAGEIQKSGPKGMQKGKVTLARKISKSISDYVQNLIEPSVNKRNNLYTCSIMKTFSD
jgi:hypothetical protein